MADLKIQILSDDYEDEVQHETRKLANLINEEMDADATIDVAEAQDGERAAGAVKIGSILLGFLSSASGLALIDILKSYFNRRSGDKIAVEFADGTKITVDGTMLEGESLDSVLASFKKHLSTGT